uniref:GPI mannosyltransferase 2 n=1 Tax=Clastoptera arizonana TaxID=38151 RepID=A0A1B6DKS1_9HEMI
MRDCKKNIFWLALNSRIFALTLSSLSNVVVPDHDPVVFKTPQLNETKSVLDHLIEFLFQGLTRWDAQYFLHISQHGYSYENTLAFFPLYPLLIKLFASILYFILSSFISFYSSIVVSAFLINLVFFIKSSVILYDITLLIFKNKEIAYKTAVFYCLNPATIFFTAFYSESCFTYFTFFGMLLLFKKRALISASICFGLSCATRSNGILNIGFLLHFTLQKYFLSRFLKCIVTLPFLFIISMLPFMAFQVFAFYTYCYANQGIFPDHVKQYGLSKGFLFPGETFPVWCNFSLPLSYSYIQDHYWNVGFLKYYQLKQIPNFLLAFPIIIFILSKSFIILKENKSLLITLGFTNKLKIRFLQCNSDPVALVFVIHIFFLTLFCTLCIHVQVTTRMLASASPVLYWLLALSYSSKKPDTSLIVLFENYVEQYWLKIKKGTKEHKPTILREIFLLSEEPSNLESYLIRTYIVLFVILGNIVFSNYYPWT